MFRGAPAADFAALHRELFRYLRWQFVLGILLAAFGGYLVTRYKPTPPPKTSLAAASEPHTDVTRRDQ